MQSHVTTALEPNHVTQALQLLEEKNTEALSQLLSELHPVQLYNLINSIDESLQLQLIKLIGGLDQLAELIFQADDTMRERIVRMLDDARIAAVIRRQETDDAADIMQLLPRRKQIGILRKLSPETVKSLSALLSYDQDTAGGLMTPEFLSFPHSTPANQALSSIIEQLKSEEIDSETDLTYIYTADNFGRLSGVCSLRDVLRADSTATLEELMTTPIIAVNPDDDQEHVARKISDYDFNSIPVVDPDSGRMIGLITIDDIIDVIQEEHTEDLLRLVGTEEEDIVGASTWVAVRSRLPWLLGSWIGGLFGASLMGVFSPTLEKTVSLAFFMPVVFGMGGNVGSQASTITVRGLATGALLRGKVRRRIIKEACTGVTLGSIFCLLLGLASFLIYHDRSLAFVVALSIASTMSCAAIIGSLLPVVFDRIGVDPAVSSGPFVTTTTDILSVIIYFGIATLLL